MLKINEGQNKFRQKVNSKFRLFLTGRHHLSHRTSIGHRTKSGKKVVQRRAANMRERRRMKSINDAFEALRTCIPSNVQVQVRKNKTKMLSKKDDIK